ncbi:hypothetical protein [Streptomyces sp. NPDC046909]|uniref:hypothetical protein n=1 Tax=Streptomyces sp. NPDC046909 TaxID=3155617 RepID=UPI0033FA99CC
MAAAHLAKERDRFPGGVFYVDLCGQEAEPLSDSRAFGVLLNYLGLHDLELPEEPAARRGHYQSLMRQRPGAALVLLDNAAHVHGVEQLLPADDRHRMLVTTRGSCDGLDAHGLVLGVLPDKVRVELLTALICMGDPTESRPDREPEALHQLAEMCGGVPGRIRQAAVRLRQNRAMPIAACLASLCEQRVADDWLLPPGPAMGRLGDRGAVPPTGPGP